MQRNSWVEVVYPPYLSTLEVEEGGLKIWGQPRQNQLQKNLSYPPNKTLEQEIITSTRVLYLFFFRLQIYLEMIIMKSQLLYFQGIYLLICSYSVCVCLKITLNTVK